MAFNAAIAGLQQGVGEHGHRVAVVDYTLGTSESAQERFAIDADLRPTYS